MQQAIEASDICATLTALVQAMVRDRDAVSVLALPPTIDGTTVLRLKVSAHEMGKMIGRGGRVARSLRIILFTIGSEQKHRYMLDIDGVPVGMVGSDGVL